MRSVLLPNSWFHPFSPQNQRITFLSFYLEPKTKEGWTICVCVCVCPHSNHVIKKWLHEQIAPFRTNSCLPSSVFWEGAWGLHFSNWLMLFFKTSQLLKYRFWITESFVLQVYFLTNLNFVLMLFSEGIYPSIIGNIKFSSPSDLPESVFRSLFVHL